MSGRGEFVKPAASLTAKQEILNSGDPIRSFVADECELDLDFAVNKDELFHRYLLHCQKIGAKQTFAKPKFLTTLMTHFNGVRHARPRNPEMANDREQVMVGIRLLPEAGRVPTITFRLDPVELDLIGLDRTDPRAILRDAAGRPVEYVTSDFDA